MMKWYVGYRIGNTYTGKYVYAKDAAQAIKRARIKNIIELYPVHEQLAKDMLECAKDIEFDDPRGTGYFNLCSYTLSEGSEDEVTLNVVVDLCKYKDSSDGHEYFGIYNVAEVDGGDNITEHDWEFTDDCSLTSLIGALQNISEALSRKELVKAYNAA